MTVTHIQVLLGKRGCVGEVWDKETDRQREKRACL